MTGAKKLLAFRLQVACHLLYVVLSFWLHGQERPLWLPLALMLAAVLVELALSKTIYRDRGYLVSLASIGVANSIYLNMEGYGAFYWPFFLALFISLAVKYLLRVDDRPIFNPSLVGVIVVAVVFPFYGTAGMYYWDSDWPVVVLVLALGSITTYFAGTIRLSYAYVLSFVAWGLAGLPLAALFPLEGNIALLAQHTPLGLWPLAIFNFGNILFAFHGIGNPETSPRSVYGQVLFGILLGTFDFWGRIFFLLNSNFVAYVIMLVAYAGFVAYRAEHR